MTTIDQVGKVLSVIFNKILELGEKLFKWLGFVFNWRDITTTKDSIVSVVQDALDEGENSLETLKDKSTKFFESLKESLSRDRPSDDDLQNLDINADDATGSADQYEGRVGESMAVNWSQYQVLSSPLERAHHKLTH